LSVLLLVFPFYGHYIVCPLPRFSFYGHYIVCPSPRFSLFMSIILCVGKTRRRTHNIMAINKEKRGEGQTI
jgi:hypothetical protein